MPGSAGHAGRPGQRDPGGRILHVAMREEHAAGAYLVIDTGPDES
jgi:hypothetical protein